MTTNTRFDDRIWAQHRAVIVTGAVSVPVLFEVPEGFRVIVSPTRKAALRLLRMDAVPATA